MTAPVLERPAPAAGSRAAGPAAVVIVDDAPGLEPHVAAWDDLAAAALGAIRAARRVLRPFPWR